MPVDNSPFLVFAALAVLFIASVALSAYSRLRHSKRKTPFSPINEDFVNFDESVVCIDNISRRTGLPVCTGLWL
ncbi:hypothetical protein NDU88_005567 [Pleurodeles waltl]|uniref:Uncharacterized protein n=1 Tax=Pleurodeles waltl TaxID=8319 RepID=A0AAV7UIF4_PLEWA|nr:hypothetical protein NDU88_005567 [Pleurodeles waltl]